MIKAPSLITESSLIYSGDPALNLPDDPAERERVLELARETGNWRDIVLPGETPTIFHVRPLYGALWDWFAGEVNRRGLVQVEIAAFALRLALRKVEGFGSSKVEFTRVDGHQMATTEILDAIYREGGGEGRTIVEELGGFVFVKASQGLRPKS